MLLLLIYSAIHTYLRLYSMYVYMLMLCIYVQCIYLSLCSLSKDFHPLLEVLQLHVSGESSEQLRLGERLCEHFTRTFRDEQCDVLWKGIPSHPC